MPLSPFVLAFAARLGLVVPLVAVCLFVIIAIPAAARSGKLTILTAGYTAVAGIILGLLAGYAAGFEGVRGTALGIVLALACFLLSATAVGSVLGVFFYREPRIRKPAS